jgi:uncharacterized protein (UPF0332 family)
MSDFQDCLKRKRIKDFTSGKNLFLKELKLAKEDLKTAKESFGNKNFKWSIIQVYYSMFHSARCLLYKKNYREKSHYCLIEAIRELYVVKGELNFSLIGSLQKAKQLREDADYYGDFSEGNAERLIKDAKNFIEEVEMIISVK